MLKFLLNTDKNILNSSTWLRKSVLKFKKVILQNVYTYEGAHREIGALLGLPDERSCALPTPFVQGEGRSGRSP